MASTITISTVAPAHVDEIAALARIVWQEAYTGIITQAQIDFMLEQRYNAPRLLEELATPGVWWDRICIDDRRNACDTFDKLAGFAASQLSSSAGEMKLDKLYVDPCRQRLGLGGRLIAHVSKRALAQGCHTLILAVNKQNARAIAAYRKNGFEVREAVRVEIGNGFVMDDFIMAKSLAADPD